MKLILILKIKSGERAQQLGVLPILAKDLNLVPSTPANNCF